MSLAKSLRVLSGIVLLILEGCGGGGGGGSAPSTSASSSNNNNSNSSSSSSSGIVSTPETTEESAAFWLHDGSGGIDALGAINAGYIGTGETAAVIDTGIADVSDFSGRLETGYDGFTGATFAAGASSDDEGHGTFVASIIAASATSTGLVGVAPGADIVPVVVIDSNGIVGGLTSTTAQTDAIVANAQNWVTSHGIKVENNSWGLNETLATLGSGTIASGTAAFEATDPNTIAAWERYVAGGGVAVWAAGNLGAAEPDANAELALGITSLQPGWLIAVGLNQQGTLDSRLSACGPAAAYCLAAPADNLIGSSTTGSAVTDTGTSFAAPQVTGALLDLLQRFPNLTAQQAAAILLQTANKSGIYADTALYGQGLLNVDAALSPIGGVTVASTQGTVTPVAATRVDLGAAFGNGLASALAATTLIVRDSYERGYAVSAAGIVASGGVPVDEGARVASFGDEAGTVLHSGPISMQFAATGGPDTGGLGAVHTDLYALSYAAPHGYALGVSYNVPANRAYTSRNAEQLDTGLILPAGVSDPYLALIDHAMTASVGVPFAGGTVTVGSAFGRAPADRWDNPFAPQSALQGMADSAVNIAYAAGIGRNASITLEGGELIEAHGLLGSGGTGVAGLGSATTFHGGIVGQIGLGPRLTLSAGLHIGETSAKGGQDSLIDSVSSVVTTAGGLGATLTGAITPGDRVDLAAGMPLKAQSGDAAITLPTAEDSSGASIYQTVSAPVKATAQEVDFQGSWMQPLDAVSRIGLAATLRANPNNVANAAPEGIVALRYATRF